MQETRYSEYIQLEIFEVFQIISKDIWVQWKNEVSEEKEANIEVEFVGNEGHKLRIMSFTKGILVDLF